MSGTHDVVFRNLRDSRTGETLRLTVPDTLPYEAGMLYFGFLGEQMAQETLATLKKSE